MRQAGLVTRNGCRVREKELTGKSERKARVNVKGKKEGKREWGQRVGEISGTMGRGWWEDVLVVDDELLPGTAGPKHPTWSRIRPVPAQNIGV